ncbi:MAG: hypothetical protein AAGC73_03065 [Verrucomicrobiota bacterium]
MLAITMAGSTHLRAEGESRALISDELRLSKATQILSTKTTYISVFVKGLVCSSCGIGLRIHLKKVPGVDTKQLDKGIDMNVDTQLVTLAIKEGESIDMERVYNAIYSAGYNPVHYFEMNDGRVQRVEF